MSSKQHIFQPHVICFAIRLLLHPLLHSRKGRLRLLYDITVHGEHKDIHTGGGDIGESWKHMKEKYGEGWRRRVTHKSRRGEIAESGLIVPERDNKACNHLSLLHRPGNYLPIRTWPPEQRGQDPSSFTLSPYTTLAFKGEFVSYKKIKFPVGKGTENMAEGILDERVSNM